MRAGSILFVCIAILFSGCGPKVVVRPELQAQPLPATLLLLPAKTDEVARAERISFIEDQVAASLENHGFRVVRGFGAKCNGAECQLDISKASAQGVMVTARVEIETISTNNFLAGYVNVLSGRLVLSDLKGGELLHSDYTQRERGGVLFHSGQLLQGVISQSQNAGDDGFNLLATKFAERVVAELPAVAEQQTDDDEVVIRGVQMNQVRPHIYRVCARSAPDSMAFLIVNQRKTNLRQVQAGEYCGVYRLEGVKGELQVEVRSPLGTAARSVVRRLV